MEKTFLAIATALNTLYDTNIVDTRDLGTGIIVENIQNKSFKDNTHDVNGNGNNLSDVHFEVTDGVETITDEEFHDDKPGDNQNIDNVNGDNTC